MKNFPQELVYVLLFAAIVLFQYMMKRFGQPPQEDVPAADEELSQFPEEVELPPAAASGAELNVGHFGRTEAPRPVRPPGRRRFSRQSLMGDRRAVQNAIVIATILGPCRADDPYDTR